MVKDLDADRARQRCDTLGESVIIITLILLLASIAMPNFSRMRKEAAPPLPQGSIGGLDY